MDPVIPLTINRPSVIFDIQGDEAVVIDLVSGRYFRLDPPSTALWERFVVPVSLAGVLESCTTADLLRPALDAIATDLVERGLLRPANGADDRDPAAAPPASWEFQRFTLEEFTDLEDILGLDPIHEVDPDKGWPHAAPA